MGVLKSLTDEYFGKTKRDEEKTPFEKYMENVEWVDIGNRSYLFAKTDFEDNTFEIKDIFEICDTLKKYGNKYSLMTKNIFQSIVKRKNTDIKGGKQDMERIVVCDKNGNETMEIKIPSIGNYDTVMFASKCDLSSSGLYYIIDYYSFMNTNSIEKLNTCKKKDSHGLYVSTSVMVSKFGIKLMKKK